ncbi:MAG: LysR family transcriptional regulator [Acetobacteraceae bacterium]|nr:LysR family transcriptional regulator [Acetobacteraceae bacterium]
MLQGIRPIRSFLAAARLGSFTRAAQEMHVSQPALTMQIRQLEEALGMRLFDRGHRQVMLTQPGRDLLAPLQKVLADLEAVMNVSHDLKGLRRGSVAVAALPSVAVGPLPTAIRRFTTENPNISLTIHDAVAERIVALVKAEEVDFAIGCRLGPDRDIEVSDFLIDRMCAYMPEGHPLAQCNPLLLRDVVAFPLVLTTRGTSVRQMVERVVEREGLDISLACDASYLSSAVSMVHAGLGISILPESAVNASSCEGVVVRPIHTPGLTRKIGILRKAGRSLSPAAERFIAVLKEISGESLEHFSSAAAKGKRRPI